MHTIIFDLDGTLADTSGDLIAAANSCFQAMGHGDLLHHVRDQETAFRGGKAMLRLGCERIGLREAELEEMIEAQYPALLSYYGDNIDTHTTLYPGVEEALDLLAEKEYRLGICTNKPEALAETLLGRLAIRSRFASMIGADTLPVRKPDPEPLREAIRRAGGTVDKAVLVGDTITDRKTGEAAGVPVVLCTFGPAGRGVELHEPEGLFDHYDGLEEVIRTVLR
jgi:phosphoglycolate phosphatase